MLRNRTLVGTLLTIVLIPATAVACLWDYDALLQERSRFPDVLELITGKFLRHSKEFYEWRVRDRLEKLKRDPENLAFYDDLAVAYEKLGQHQKAIDTILVKDRKHPGLYETEANLGTFYIHAGQLEKGLQHIDKAIQINPDAHFGREKYQELLVQYVLERHKAGRTKPPLSAEPGEWDRREFCQYLRTSRNLASLDNAERQAALKGLLGMMRFGNYDSPVLLEALGSVLSYGASGAPDQDAKRLATRAYLKVSHDVPDEAARKKFRDMAFTALMFQSRYPAAGLSHASDEQVSVDEVEAAFKRELADAESWYADLRQKEISWIKEGKNPEEEFAKLYTSEPVAVSGDPPPKERTLDLTSSPIVLGLWLGGIGFMALIAVAFLRRRAGRRSAVARRSRAVEATDA